jgi:hypothetical protein
MYFMKGSNGNQPGQLVLTIAAFLAAMTVAVPSRAQIPTPPLPRSTPPADFAEVDGNPENLTQPKFLQPVVAPSYDAGEATERTAPRIEMSLLDTITGSLFGDVYAPGQWRPLSLGSFFSEGWFESWAAAPAGQDDLTPRQGWLGAFNGLFFRLWASTLSYSNSLNKPYRGDSYTGSYDIFLPFSRRFEIDLVVPFVASNGTLALGRRYVSEFGDLTVTPRFLLAETAAATHILAVDILIPTGSRATGNGVMALQPRYAFWWNPGGPWVFRGGSGVYVPLNAAQGPSGTAYSGDLAVGRYVRRHDVPFGDLVFYAATNWKVPLDGTNKTMTYFGVGPGTRFHIARNFFFLNYWEFPLVGPHPYTYNMQVALLKVF